MLDPHRTFVAGTRPDEPRVEPRVEPSAALRMGPFDADAAEAPLMRALVARVRRTGIERAPATLRERVRAMLDARD